MLKEGMRVQLKPNTVAKGCSMCMENCNICMKGKLIMKKNSFGDLLVHENEGRGNCCSRIPKSAIIPLSWREKYAKHRN